MSTLYVCDLDGTLLNDEQTVSSEAEEILNALIDQGLAFTIATARSWESAGNLIQGLRLKWPVVLINGVFVYDPIQGKNVRENYLTSDTGASIVRDYLAAGLNPIVYTMGRDGQPNIYYRGIFNESEALYIGNRLGKGDRRFKLVDSFEPCLQESLITINAIDEPGRLAGVYDRYRLDASCFCHFGPDIYAPDFHWLEIASAQATKREAVLYLKEQLGFDRLVCFGDNLNDLPMFEAADEKYAVRNAHELVKAAANQVIDSNNEHGVPRYLQGRHGASDGALRS